MSSVIDLARRARGSFAFMVAAAIATGGVAACNESNAEVPAGACRTCRAGALLPDHAACYG